MSDHEAAVEIARLQAEVKRLNSEQTDCYTDLNSARQDNASLTEGFKALRATNERLRAALRALLDASERHIFSTECQTERDAARAALAEEKKG